MSCKLINCFIDVDFNCSDVLFAVSRPTLHNIESNVIIVKCTMEAIAVTVASMILER